MSFNKNKKKPSLKQRLLSWKFWFLISIVLLMIFFGFIEYISKQKQPSEEWSSGILITDDLPDDYRKISHNKRLDKEGIVMAYVVENGIKLIELNWLGEIERSSLIEMDSSNIKVLDIGVKDNIYYVYYSDRKALDRIDLDIATLDIIGEKSISQTSEQFSAVGDIVIAGDNNVTEIIIDNKVVAEFKGYDDLKKVRIKTHDEKIYAIMDTVHGGSLIVVDGDNVVSRQITDSVEQGVYGYLSDIYVADGLITVMSNKFYIHEVSPTTLGVWQFDEKTLEQGSFQPWKHGRTSLEPRIVNVSGNKITYILGVQQNSTQSKERIMRFPETQSGTFTNVSSFTRDNGSLTDITRLTLTRRYPIGYDYYKSPEGEVIVWADRVEKNSAFMLAGKGETWISHAKSLEKPQYSELIQETLFSFASVLFLGVLMFILEILRRWFVFVGFAIVSILYYKFAPINNAKKSKHILIGAIALIIGIKLYLASLGNISIKQYADIYPVLLGSDLMLGALSLITSLCSIFLLVLWQREYNHVNEIARIGIFFGFEAYFYLFTVMVYVISAMNKATSLI